VSAGATLALIAVAEAVVLLLRMRAAVGPSAAWSAATAFLTCALRLAFVALGARLVIDQTIAGPGFVWAVAAYAGTAGVATWAVHEWCERRAGWAEGRPGAGGRGMKGSRDQGIEGARERGSEGSGDHGIEGARD
jgi:hypothetical protein